MPFEKPEWMPGDDKAPSVEREAAVSRFWKENGIFAKSLRLREGAPQYVFYEGPPTANGRPHPGHVLTRVMKDLFPRYHTMTGKLVPRKAGWDTHGLPVEIEVEKELGLGSKEDIEKYGVEPFVKKCMQSVFRYTQDWEELTDRIGFWIDLSDAYVTYTREYVESVWWAVSQLWKKGLLYKGHKIVPWCTRCGTALSSHEVGWGYKTVSDPSITVKFKVKGKENTFLLAWTTTPWTLLSNAALAVHPEAEYERVQDRDTTSGEVWIVAHPRRREMLPLKGDSRQVTDTAADPDPSGVVRPLLKGSDLVGWEYEPLFPPPDSMLEGKKAHRVIAADFVTLDEGTGIVHIAPAFGADDQEVGKACDLPTIVRTDERGMMTEDTPFAGRYCKEADPDIMRDLKERGLLVDRRDIEHDYPHCWRCDTPLLYYARVGWFIKTTEFRDRMLEVNRTVNWYPDHIKEGRFGNFLRDNVDWALSRERYWGTPLPIWHCESNCGKEPDGFESLDELREMPGAAGFEVFDEARRKEPALSEHLAIHKPYIDAVTYECPKCGGTMRRVPEVIDCWFDSGAMPFAQWGWPGGGEEADREFRAAHPADFISEAIDQTRGWFYSLLAISTMLFDKAPYENCVVLGLVCDEKGAKMSKSKGNYVEPKAILDTQGADALRWYFLSANQPWTSMRFSERNVSMANKDFLIKLRNVYSFFRIYARIDGFDPAKGGEPLTDARPSKWGERSGRRRVEQRMLLDRWILSELARAIRAVRESMDAYDSFGASQALSTFVESLSNWYLRRSRDRFWGPDKGDEMSAGKFDAYWTLYECLVTTSLLIAPFTPFAAEEFYQTLVRSAFPGSAPESVHLLDYPTTDEFATDEELARGMALAREASALGRAARAQAKIKVRMPLSEATVVAPDATGMDARLVEAVADVVKDELNVKGVNVTRVAPQGMRLAVKPNYRRLGPELGPRMPEFAESLRQYDQGRVRDLWEWFRTNGTVELSFSDGSTREFYREDFEFRVSAEEGFAAASGSNLLVMLDAHVTDELRREGLARELVSKIQGIRRDLDLPYEARIETAIAGSDRVREAVRAHERYVMDETLTVKLLDSVPEGVEPVTAKVEGDDVTFAVREVKGAEA